MAEATHTNNETKVFFSYAHEDKDLCEGLIKHLSNLKRKHVITDWYDRQIGAGEEWDEQIAENLKSAGIILLLISADFMASDYCHDVEVARAMARHEAGDARVIPIILRPCDWSGAAFSKLQALPTDARPITKWENRDEAFLCVVQGIQEAIRRLQARP